MKLLKSTLRARIVGVLLVSVFLWLLPIGESFETAGELLEAYTLDLRFSFRPPPESPSPVTIVILNGERERPPGRLLRSDLADMLELMSQLPGYDRPASLVVDVALTRPPRNPGAGDEPEARLIHSTTALGTVTNALIFAYSLNERRDPPTGISFLEPYALPLPQSPPPMRVAAGIRLASPDFAKPLYTASRGVGFISLTPPSRRSTLPIVRQLPLLTRFQPQTNGGSRRDPRVFLSSALAGVATAICNDTPIDACIHLEPDAVVIKGSRTIRVPVSGHGDFRINYRKRFRTYIGGRTSGAWTNPLLPPQVVLFHSNAPLASHLGTSQSSSAVNAARTQASISAPFFDGECSSAPAARSAPGWFSDLDGSCIPAEKMARQLVLVVDGQELPVARTPLGFDYPLSTVHAQTMANFWEEDYLGLFPTTGIAERVPPGLSAACLSALLLALLIRRARRVKTGSRAPLRFLSEVWQERLTNLAVVAVTPEVLLATLWTLAALLVFFWQSMWVPLVAPFGVFFGSLVGWFMAMPLELNREIHTLESHKSENSTLLKTLQSKSLELESTRAELASQRAAALEQGKWSQEEESLISTSKEELKALDELLSETHETLARHLLPPDRFQPLSPVNTDVNSLLEQLSRGKAEIHSVRDQLEKVQAEIDHLEPRVDLYRKWYRAWAPAYHGLLSPLKAILDQAGTIIARLGPEVAPVPETTETVVVSSDRTRELFEKTRCMTGDPDMAELLRTLIEVSGPSDEAILILGETGTGKELVARAIHDNSPRGGGNRPYIVRNCATLQPTLAESELFGHRKGAHSGANTDRPGLFVEADGGTLVLDELGEMPLEVQAKLLRVLQDMVVTPLGGDKKHQKKVDVRVVASTNADLEERVQNGRFRADLYYRLQRMSTVNLPPLRDRPRDVALLLTYFLEENFQLSNAELSLSPEAMAHIKTQYDWPGNVRELEGFALKLAKSGHRGVIGLQEVHRFLGGSSGSRKLDESQIFTRDDARGLYKLNLMREHQFNFRSCGEDVHYAGNRQTAQRHARVLMAIALWNVGWDVVAASELLAGPRHTSLTPVVRDKMEIFLSGLETRLGGRRSETAEGLQKSIKREYGSEHRHVLRLVDALRNGWIRRRDSE